MHKSISLLVMLLLLSGCNLPRATATQQPPSTSQPVQSTTTAMEQNATSAASSSLSPGILVALPGTTEKICQLTGNVDWETGLPTAAKTLSNYGLDAVDLGYPVENQGKLILLFGDSGLPHIRRMLLLPKTRSRRTIRWELLFVRLLRTAPIAWIL